MKWFEVIYNRYIREPDVIYIQPVRSITFYHTTLASAQMPIITGTFTNAPAEKPKLSIPEKEEINGSFGQGVHSVLGEASAED